MLNLVETNEQKEAQFLLVEDDQLDERLNLTNGKLYELKVWQVGTDYEEMYVTDDAGKSNFGAINCVSSKLYRLA